MANTYLDHDIPEGRKKLIECNENLIGIAQYCEQNYAQSNDKREALGTTRNFTTQSLASVAYQVNTLASSMLNLLSEQDDELSRLCSALDNLSERVDIHMEKVARREVGQLTARKPITKQQTLLSPANPERPVKYIRKQINYNELDEIGHGIKTGSSGTLRASKNASINSRNSATLSRSESQLESRSQYNTIGRKVGIPIVPKNIPPQFHQESMHRERKHSGASNNSYDSNKFPVTVNNGSSNRSSIIDGSGINEIVPVSHMDQLDGPMGQNYDLPPPPEVLTNNNFDGQSLSSNSVTLQDDGFPTMLPPPPAEAFETEIMNTAEFRPSPGMTARRSTDPNWAPVEYIERVKAVYDYEADNHDELTFDEDAIIYVVAKNEDGWWEGILGDPSGNGRAGLFPHNYVEVLSN